MSQRTLSSDDINFLTISLRFFVAIVADFTFFLAGNLHENIPFPPKDSNELTTFKSIKS